MSLVELLLYFSAPRWLLFPTILLLFCPTSFFGGISSSLLFSFPSFFYSVGFLFFFILKVHILFLQEGRRPQFNGSRGEHWEERGWID